MHKYAYVHGDPIQGLDPTGKFLGVVSFLSGLGTQGQLRASNQTASVGAKVSATNNIRKTVQLYQKALRIFHNIHDKYQDLMDLVDILQFDPRSIRSVVNQLAAGGLDSALDAGPNVRIPVSIKMPPAMMNKMQGVWDFLFKMGLGHQKVQEFLGELATGIIIQALGYDLPPLTLDAVHGPDQVARHSGTGVWGVFEAKGGTSKLGTKATNMGGPQMSHKWISGWIEELIRKNAGTEYGKKLKDSYGDEDVMLAAVTRMRIYNKPNKKIGAEFELVAQKYEPDEPNGMLAWGAGW